MSEAPSSSSSLRLRLCRCGHFSDQHPTSKYVTEETLTALGVMSPCSRCSISADRELRKSFDMLCTGFDEWPINEVPYPGTQQAVWIGCVCPTGVNVQRAARRLEPLYAPGCPVHDWICKRRVDCAHDGLEKLHDRPHQPCEHCTVPNIECSVCGEVWADWRVDSRKVGWSRLPIVLKPGSIMSWLCPNCNTKDGE